MHQFFKFNIEVQVSGPELEPIIKEKLCDILAEYLSNEGAHYSILWEDIK